MKICFVHYYVIIVEPMHNCFPQHLYMVTAIINNIVPSSGKPDAVPSPGERCRVPPEWAGVPGCPAERRAAGAAAAVNTGGHARRCQPRSAHLQLPHYYTLIESEASVGTLSYLIITP